MMYDCDPEKEDNRDEVCFRLTRFNYFSNIQLFKNIASDFLTPLFLIMPQDADVRGQDGER